MAVVRELACRCGAVLAAAGRSADQPAVRSPVCGEIADVELSTGLVGTIGAFDPAGPALQVILHPGRATTGKRCRSDST